MASAIQLEDASAPTLKLASDQLLSIEEVAELLNVPISWVYSKTWRRTMNRIPGFRLGKYWRFRRSDVFAWLERQKAGGN